MENVFKLNENEDNLGNINLIFVYLQGYPILNFFTDEIKSMEEFKTFLDKQSMLLTSVCKFMCHEYNEPLFRVKHCESIFKQSHIAVEYLKNKIHPMKVFHYYLYPEFLEDYLNKEYYQLSNYYLDLLSAKLKELGYKLDKVKRI